MLFVLSGCAQTTIRPVAQIADRQVPRPARILVKNFAIDGRDVTEYQGILRQQPPNPNALERQRVLAEKTTATLTEHLMRGLRQLGFAVESAGSDTVAREHDLVVDGRVTRVDEGSPLRRLILGFGAGAARMETRVQAYYGVERRKILQFATRAESGSMPGAVATAPAGAAAPASVAVGIAAGSVMSKAVQADLGSTEQMAVASAEQAARFLSEFFARQGWIESAQVRKARLATH